ncbi:MAG: phosphoenolpyruvate hydrolase family protein [Alphaproteobacteria bacterium]|nr:phosphoenolpyruvate hydrolase family protein [Alphaproteobacteria bacterium]
MPDNEFMDYLTWPVEWRSRKSGAGLFHAVATPVPALLAEGLPAEVGLLLPNRNSQPVELAIADRLAAGDGARPALGLFMANPFLKLDTVAAACQSASIEWIVNLPSVAQQDSEFGQQLEDVGLDLTGELRRLDALHARGLRTAAVVTDAEGAEKAIAAGAEVLIVLPRVSDFAAGFPSSRQRGTAIQLVRNALASSDWQGSVLGLGDATEAAHPALWPEGVDGLMIRPKAA